MADNMFVLNFSAYTQPEFTEQRGKDWINFGKQNDYPSYLLKCFQQSSKHNAIITGKVDYIIGDGWKGNVEEFIKSPNNEENLKELSSKVALDIEIFGGCYIEVITAKTTRGKVQFRHLPFNRMRTNEDLSKFYYSKNWTSNYGTMETSPDTKPGWKVYPAYDPNKSQPSSIYYYQLYTPKDSKFPVYPLPEYIGALPYIELDYEIANFHVNNVKNSFIGSFLINFLDGKPTEEKKREIQKKFIDKFAGTDNAGKFVLNFSDSKERGVEITPLNPPDLDKMFMLLNDMVRQEIFTSHKVTSTTLFGVATAGALGQRNEILDAYELFSNTYIRNRRTLLENIFNYLLVGNRDSQTLTLKEKPPLTNKITLADIPSIAPYFTTEQIQNIIKKNFNVEMDEKEVQLLPVEMKSEVNEDLGKRIIQKLSKVGRPKDDFIIWKTRYFTFNGDYDAIEARMQRMLFASPLSGNVKDKDGLKVLEILDKRPDATPAEISRELNIKESKIKEILNELTTAGLIDSHGGITPTGDRSLPPTDAVVSDISVRYAYAKDPTAPGGLLIPTSREFCKDLVNMNKLFTRDEIEQISNEEDYSVFLFRGGWYRNPDTGETTPYCRHMWQSVVVTEKTK